MKRLLSIIIQREQLPFETEADVGRWCLHHGLKQLAAMMKDEEITSNFGVLQTWQRTEGKARENLFYKKRLDSWDRTVNELADAGFEMKALELAELVWRQTDKLDDPDWRETWRRVAKANLDGLRKKVQRREREKARLEERASRNGGGE